MKLGELFDIKMGPSLELVRLDRDDGPSGINFVSRTSRNNGVSARVAVIEGLEPDAGETLSVALGGSVLETFYQPDPWYSGRDIAVLSPIRDMTVGEMLWWASCIRANAYRFSYGRQANRTLAALDLPDQVPSWVNDTNVRAGVLALTDALAPMELAAIPKFSQGLQRVDDLFDIQSGNALTLAKLKRVIAPDGVNFIARSRFNSGITARVMPPDAGKIWDDGLITVALSGSSVLSSFVQLEPFVTAFHVAVLVPRREMGLGEKLWWCRCIEANQYRYNFGRQANRTLASLRVPTSIPEWVGTAPNTASGELRDSLLEIADSISESSELEKTADLLGKLLKVPKTKAKN